MLFYWYQLYHWYQWRPFLSPLTPMESICEYWTTLRKFFRSCAAIVLVSTGTHLMYVSLALRYRENAAINKEQMQTKYSDVINFYSIIASYCCLLDPPLHCPALYRPVLCFSPLDDEEQNNGVHLPVLLCSASK